MKKQIFLLLFVVFALNSFSQKLGLGMWVGSSSGPGPGGVTPTYYFANNGNDSNDGLSSSRPKQTLTALNLLTIQPGEIVALKSGDTFAGTINVSNSGTSGNPITYTSYGSGAKPIITGFTAVTGWTDEGGGIYSKAVTVESNPEIVTINGVQYAMGRTPNSDRYNPQYSDYYHIDSFTGDSIITDSECNAAATDWDGAQIVIRSSNYFNWTKKTIKSHTGTSINFGTGSGNTNAIGFGYFIQNDLRTLDQFGEWYYGGGKFYMYFGAATPTDYGIKVSTNDVLINVNRNDYVTINNLKLEGANKFGVTGRLSGLSDAYNLTINNCEFDFNYTSIFGYQSPNVKVTNCNILRSSNTGVYIVWNSDGANINNNVIDSTALVIGAFDGNMSVSSGTAITCTYIRQNLSSKKAIIEGNNIYNTAHNGITYSGDSILVTKNLISNSTILQADGGSIYYGGQDEFHGIEVINNICINNNNQNDGTGLKLGSNISGFGIYFDYKTISGATAINNTIANIDAAALYLHMNQNITIEDNTIYNADQGIRIQELEGYSTPTINASIKKNVIVSDSPQLLYWAKAVTNKFRDFGVVDSNYYSSKYNNSDDFATLYGSGNWSETYWGYAGWKDTTTFDNNSYYTLNTGNNTIFDYNNGKIAKTVALTGSYMSADSVTHSGSYTLQPWESIVLFKDTLVVPEPPAPIVIDSLYAVYHLNETTGDVIDSTANGNNALNLSTTRGIAGKFGNGYNLDAINELVYHTWNTADLTNDNYSISFWFKIGTLASTLAQDVSIYTDYKSSSPHRMVLTINSENRLIARSMNIASESFYSYSATGVISATDTWYHVIVNIPKVGEAAKIFINGVHSSSIAQVLTGTAVASDYRFRVGSTVSNTVGNVTYDEIMIRNKWTNDQEALHIYEQGMTGVIYPNLDE